MQSCAQVSHGVQPAMNNTAYGQEQQGYIEMVVQAEIYNISMAADDGIS